MTEKEIDVLTQRVLRNDRRRIWVACVFCVFAWMLVVMMPWATIMPMLAKVGEFQHDKIDPEQMAMVVRDGVMATFFGSIVSMFAAAICTVFLIIFSRKATLRQVNTRLAEISAQIKLLGESH